MGDARRAALTVLEKCRRSGAWSDAVLGSAMDAERLDPRDRRLAASIAYGVIQNRMLLDHLISGQSSIELKKIEPKVLDLLRVGVCQILLMDKIPVSAAVDSTVKISKELGLGRASGYINGVLRGIARQEICLPEGSDAAALSLRYSHPLWLTELYLRLLDLPEAIALLSADNAPVPITLQVNTLQTSTDALLEELANAGCRCRVHPSVPDCILLDSGTVGELSAFRRGGFYVQDAAAKMAVMAAAPKQGQRILDVCAAPGGKTFAAAILSGGAEITSCDLHENKLRRIRDGAGRMQLHGIKTIAQDARTFVPDFAEGFDIVIADVPCSGLGVIRKKPDIRYKDPSTFVGLPEIQAAILDNVARYVKPGGTLLYSTCTIRPEENGAVCSAFLSAHKEYAYDDFSLPGGLTSSSGMLQLWPQRDGTDGFFIARMRKWN